jgi:hypothetical protein
MAHLCFKECGCDSEGPPLTRSSFSHQSAIVREFASISGTSLSKWMLNYYMHAKVVIKG